MLLYRLTWQRFGRAVAVYAVLLLAIFPFGFFFGAAYSEAPYLLLAVITFMALERHQWWLAATSAMLAGAVRPTGVLLGATVLVAYGLDWYTTRHGWRWDWLWLALAPLGTLAYFTYCWARYGDFFAYQHASARGWHGGYLQWGALQWALRLLTYPASWLAGSNPMVTLYGVYLALALVFLVALVPVYNLLGPSYTFFAFVSVVTPLVTFPALDSLGRYLSVIFPVFIVAAFYLQRRPWLLQVVVVACSLFLALFAYMFLIGVID